MGKDYEAPWSVYETFYSFIGQMTREIIGEQQWQPEFDAIWKTRTPEDYSGSNNKQKDFERTWYHSRTPEQNTTIDEIDGEQATVSSEVMKYAERRHQSFENKIAGEDFVNRFKASLSDVDRKIIELREAGKTLAEIADQVGFAGAGTVSKHLFRDWLSTFVHDRLHKLTLERECGNLRLYKLSSNRDYEARPDSFFLWEIHDRCDSVLVYYGQDEKQAKTLMLDLVMG